MATEILSVLVRANLAAGLAILAVLALRIPARRLFGARLAYVLWLMVPTVCLANLLPAGPGSLPEQAPAIARLSTRLGADLGGQALAVWAAGALAAVAAVAWSQHRFLRRAARGLAGPAVVGVAAPRMVVPAGHAERCSPEERALIRAHERAHIDRGDPQTNALIALAQCLNWFNPLVHLAARYVRVDQELACDAAVIARHPRQRRPYAQTMLKVQTTSAALPLGCHWGAHPLETRITMLGARAPSDRREAAGVGVLALLVLTAGYAAWAAQPAGPPRPEPVYAQPSRAMYVLMVDLTPRRDTVVLGARP